MKLLKIFASLLLIAAFALCAIGSGESSTEDQGSGAVSKEESTAQENLGKYSVTIDSCRLASDYEGNAVVIVKYTFKNVSDEDPASFMFAFDDAVYQNGVELEHAYFLADDANYDSENQSKDIKKGASLAVEIAYELDDTTTSIEVEVEELISFNDKKITKTFSLQ